MLISPVLNPGSQRHRLHFFHSRRIQTLEVWVQPHSHPHLLDRGPDKASCFSVVGWVTLQKLWVHVDCFLPMGMGRACVRMIKFGNLGALLKERCSQLSQVNGQLEKMGRGIWLAITGEGDSVSLGSDCCG